MDAIGRKAEPRSVSEHLEPVNDGRPAEGRAGNHRGGIPLTEMVRRPDGTASEAAAL